MEGPGQPLPSAFTSDHTMRPMSPSGRSPMWQWLLDCLIRRFVGGELCGPHFFPLHSAFFRIVLFPPIFFAFPIIIPHNLDIYIVILNYY